MTLHIFFFLEVSPIVRSRSVSGDEEEAGFFDPGIDRRVREEWPRSFFVLVYDHGKDQVENLHRILCNVRVKARLACFGVTRGSLASVRINRNA